MEDVRWQMADVKRQKAIKREVIFLFMRNGISGGTFGRGQAGENHDN